MKARGPSCSSRGRGPVRTRREGSGVRLGATPEIPLLRTSRPLDSGSVTIEVAGARSILRDPVFARLWFIQASNQVGGNMALYALTVLVFSTTRSNSAVSALLVSFVLPQIALSPFAGVIVDRLDLRWALIVPNVIRTVLTAGLALAGPNLAMVLALNLGVSLMSVALTPAEGSMIPRVVPKAQLEVAMSVFNLTLQASFAVGFAFLGPLMVSIAGPSFVLGVVTVFYVAASLACIGLPSAPPIASNDDEQRRSFMDPIRELREGLAVVRRERLPMRLSAALARSSPREAGPHGIKTGRSCLRPALPGR